MKQRGAGSVALTAWLAIIGAGCASSQPAAETGGGADALVPCKNPRPEMCTMQYDPVCGSLETGGEKTYSNACVACSDRAVTGYRSGACAADRQ
jgi:hypothetical protein